MPYLETGTGARDGVDAFMFALGALTAVAYCLRMVDLHLENLLVFDGKPVIVDPECILYNFASEASGNRLLSTGLLSHNPGLSALRGGDVKEQQIVHIGLCEGADGILDYRKPATSFHNRFRGADGQLADPAAHRSSLIGGFTAAYDWFRTRASLVSDILDHRVPTIFESDTWCARHGFTSPPSTCRTFRFHAVTMTGGMGCSQGLDKPAISPEP